MKTLSPEQFKKEIEDGGIIIDVRTPGEFKESRIENAINIDFYNASFSKIISNLDKEKKYLLYCRSGARSREAVSMFTDSGFLNVFDLDGGIVNW